MKHFITSLVFCCALTACIAQQAPATSPATAFENLAMDLRKKAETQRHYVANPTTPPDQKAFYQGKADAYEDAADTALWYASLFPETSSATANPCKCDCCRSSSATVTPITKQPPASENSQRRPSS